MRDVEEQLLRGRPARAARGCAQRLVCVHVELAIHALLVARHRIVALRHDVRRPLGAVDGEVDLGGRRVVLENDGDFAEGDADARGGARGEAPRGGLQLRPRDPERARQRAVQHYETFTHAEYYTK